MLTHPIHWRPALIGLLLSVSIVAAAEAAPTLYVRTRGNDAFDGSSPAKALRSIRVAARKLTATGGRVIVGSGTYVERDISPHTDSGKGTRTEPLEFVADRDGSMTGDLAGLVVVDARDAATAFLVYGERNVRIDGFHVWGGQDAGIQVRYNQGASIAPANVTIANCVVFDSPKRGVDVQDTAGAVVFNNLVYGNGASGISVGGDTVGSSDAVVAHNTSVGNGRYGILVGEGNAGPVASTNVVVVSNVVAGNVIGGIKVAPATEPTYSSAFNINADTFEPITRFDPTDRQADPLLVNAGCANPAADGGTCSDADFRVAAQSPAIDHGPADVSVIGLSGSIRDDDSLDEGIVDAGYHAGNGSQTYPLPPLPLVPIFVRASGSDGNDGATPERALRSIRQAAAVVRSGHRVVVGAGIYAEGDINVSGRSGTAHRPIEFVGDVDGVLTGDAGPVVVNASGGYQTGFNILGSSHVVVDGFVITGGSDSGIQVRARATDAGLEGANDVTVCNSIVVSNPGNGILVRDSANATVFNNLVYANGTGGVSVGGYDLGSPNARVVNNTVYRNGVHGILIGNRTFDDGLGSPGAVVMNNLLEVLDSRIGKGLLVTPLSLANYTGAGNLDRVIDGEFNFVAPLGRDNRLGGAGFVDDDFRLDQRTAGQTRTSVAVDRGSAAAALMGLHLGSTRTDVAADDGLADAGFHYGRGENVRPVVGAINSLEGRVAPASTKRTVYVNTDGNDGSDGHSPAGALATIGAAARIALPGDLVVVAPGRYAEGDISASQSGTAVQPIAFVGDRSGKLSGVAPGVVLIDAAGFDTGFGLLNRSWIHIRGFHITNAAQAGVQVRPCAGTPEHCAADTGSDHVTVADNVIFSGRRGVEVVNSSDATIFNNLIYAHAGGGIVLRGETRAARYGQVLNNTLYGNVGDAILLDGVLGAPNTTVLNNLIEGSGLLGVKTTAESRTGLVLSHNINRDGVSPGTPADRDDPQVSPRFVWPAGPDRVLGGAGFADDDFRLKTTLAFKGSRSQRRPTYARSAAIDAGALPARDIALTGGVARDDGAQDEGVVDLGFHYPVVGPLDGLAEATVRLFVQAGAGDDASDGLTPATALRTIGRAAAQAGAGTTIVIAPGRYPERDLTPVGSGTPGHPIVFLGDTTGALTGVAPGPVVIDAKGGRTGFRLAGKHHLRLDGLHVTGATLAGVLAQNTSDLEVINSRIFSNVGRGLLSVRPRGANTFFNNLIYANGGDGVQVRLRQMHDSAVRLINNTIAGNGGDGVWIDRSVSQRRLGAVLLAHNIIQENRRDLIVTPGGWNALRVLPNLLSQPASGVTADELRVTTTVFPAAPGADGILGAAGFADDDFRVPSDSVAVDMGQGFAAAWALSDGSVRLDRTADTGPVDLGYHYGR